MKIFKKCKSGWKTIYLLIFLPPLFYSCSNQNENKNLTIGFGKANLTQAGIYEDPITNDQDFKENLEYAYEEKFGISDRIEGRWRPGSGDARHIADSIYVSAMYGEDVNGPWAIVALDEGEIFYELLDILQYPLIHNLGIPKERLIFLPSHCHSLPRMNPEKYQKTVFDAVKQAKDNRSEVEIASLDLSINGKKYSVNRRVFVNGIGTHTIMFNDGCKIHDDYLDATENIHDWVENLGINSSEYLNPNKKYIASGEVDDNLQAILIRDKKSGEMKGSFLRFSSHAVIVSAKMVNGDVSADFPGYMKRKIENELGGIALFGQGASGDLRPLNKEYSHQFAKEYGENLADQIIQSSKELKWEPLTELKYYTEPVTLPLMDNLVYSKKEMKKEMGELEILYDKETNPWQKRVLQNEF